jgi:hypothetical protein
MRRLLYEVGARLSVGILFKQIGSLRTSLGQQGIITPNVAMINLSLGARYGNCCLLRLYQLFREIHFENDTGTT